MTVMSLTYFAKNTHLQQSTITKQTDFRKLQRVNIISLRLIRDNVRFGSLARPLYSLRGICVRRHRLAVKRDRKASMPKATPMFRYFVRF